MTVSRLALFALCLCTAAYAGEAGARDCAPTIRIEDTTPLAFGTVSLPKGGGGIVLLSAHGPVATVGRLSAGFDSHPGVIRLCGPANSDFSLMIRPTGAAVTTSRRNVSSDIVSELELRATVGSVRSAGPDEWIGRLGGHGVAEIQVGGSLRLFSVRPGETLSLPFHISIEDR